MAVEHGNGADPSEAGVVSMAEWIAWRDKHEDKVQRGELEKLGRLKRIEDKVDGVQGALATVATKQLAADRELSIMGKAIARIETTIDELVIDVRRAVVGPIRPPADSVSTEIDRVGVSIRPKSRELARVIANKSDPDDIERDLEGFGRTVIRSYAWSQKTLKRAGQIALALTVAAHLVWDVLKTHWH
jgi:hypothetical protein